MFSLIENIQNRKIIGQIDSVKEFVNYVKNENRAEIGLIKNLRGFSANAENYKTIIKTLSALNFHFNFENKYISTHLATTSTEYLYYELSNLQEMDIDITYITAFWRTIKNDGYGILIGVKNINKENFQEYYKAVGEILHLPYSKHFGYISKTVVISYDSDAHFNETALFFEKKDLEAQLFSHPQDGHDSNLCNHKGGKLKLSNYENVISEFEITFNKDGVHDFGKDKMKYTECFVPKYHIFDIAREKNLFAFGRCIISVNPEISYTELKFYLNTYNNKYFFRPFAPNEFVIILNTIYGLRGKIEPIANKDKRFHYDDNVFTNTKQKRQYSAKIINAEQKERTIKYIVECLKNWDYEFYPKITQIALQKCSGKNIKTIEKYYQIARERAGLK